jgi:transcriptional regulator with XRE-family HTH domain
MRTELGMTITTVAGELGQWVSIISRLERGQIRKDDLAATYRQWLLEKSSAARTTS